MTAGVSRRRRLVLLVAVGILTVGLAVGLLWRGTAPGEPSPTTPPTGSDAAGVRQVEIGETVEATGPGGAPTVIRFTVRSIDVLTACPGRAEPSQQPEYEAFVVLELTASLEAVGSAQADDDAIVRLGADVFQTVSPGGDVHGATASAAAWACFEPSALLPPFVGVGESVGGLLVLDAASARGSVVYAPAGWAWTY